MGQGIPAPPGYPGDLQGTVAWQCSTLVFLFPVMFSDTEGDGDTSEST